MEKKNEEGGRPIPSMILVLGKTGVGKSTFIKAATGLDVETGDGLISCMRSSLIIHLPVCSIISSDLVLVMNHVLTLHHEKTGTADVQIYPVANTHTFVIDTPGFDDPFKTDIEILQQIASCLADLHESLTFPNTSIDLSGIVYLHAINESRMTGTMLKNLRMLGHLIGYDNMENNVVLATSKWSLVEDVTVAEDRESELMRGTGYWKGFLEAGAALMRFEDSRASALEIIKVAEKGGMFLPQLTREYVINGMELCQTAAGREIDEEMAKARDKRDAEMTTLRKEHQRAFELRRAEAAKALRSQMLAMEAKIKAMDVEMEKLRATRSEAQDVADEADSRALDTPRSPLADERRKSEAQGLVDEPDSKSLAISRHSVTSREEKHRARSKRALRWFGRFAALGAGITITVLTAGAMAPIGISIVAGVESMCQADKDRELRRRLRDIDSE